MTQPTFFSDDVAVLARELEVPAANFDNGVNFGASCAPGIGININKGAVVGTPEQFTLLDQRGIARSDGQISQSIGGLPYVNRSTVPWPGSGGTAGFEPEGAIRFGNLPTQAAKDADPSIDGKITPVGNAALTVLSTGWIAAI